MRRSTRRRVACCGAAIVLLLAVFAAIPAAHAATSDSRGTDATMLNDVAAQGKQGMNKLLHWAIENSNAEELKHMAQNAGQEDQEKSLQQRKKEFEEVMEHARQLPSEADIMKMALAIAANTTEDEITRVRALQLIQEYVEDIDLANDLPGMGGNDVLVDCILEKGGVQLQALRVLHTAAANNVQFQQKILEKEGGIVPWMLEKLSSDDGTPTRNACDQSQAELQDTAALTRTIAAMARNLPASTTKLLEFELADSYKGLPTKHKEFDTSGEKSLISDGLLVLFSTAMQHLQCMDDQGPEGKETRNMHASIARVALGLLSDLAANDEAVRRVLQSHVDKERPWQGGVLWGVTCMYLTEESASGKGDLPELLLQLLRNMLTPVPDAPQPPLSLTVGGWPCVQVLLDALTDAEDDAADGPAPSTAQLKALANNGSGPDARE